jgi:MFS transporter, FSR family, fosmidomycin resistance protein
MTEPVAPTDTDSADRADFQTSRVTSIAAAHAVNDTFTAFLPPLLPTFVERFSLTNAAAGLLAAFLQVPSLLQPFIGHLADRTTLRWIVVLAPGVTAATMSFLGWAPGYAALALLLLVAGLSVAAFHSTAPVAVGYLSGNRLGRGMGFWMVGGELGRTLGPLVVVSALALVSLKQIAFLALAGVATSVVLYFRLRDVPLRTRDDGEQVPWRIALGGMRNFMAVLAGLTVMRSMMMLATTVFLPLYLTENGTSLWLAGAALSIVEAAGVAGAFAGGWISDHVGRRAVLVFGHLTAPVALLLFLTVDGWVRIAMLVVVGFSLLAVPPVIMALVQEQAPKSRALANGFYLSMSMAIRAIAAIGYGAFADRFGLETAMVMGAVAMFGGLPLIWLLFSPSVSTAPADG